MREHGLQVRAACGGTEPAVPALASSPSIWETETESEELNMKMLRQASSAIRHCVGSPTSAGCARDEGASSLYAGVRIAGFCVLAVLIACSSAYTADVGTEFGAQDDLTVSGTQGTSIDADLEVKGYSVFGTSGVGAAVVTQGVGNVYVAGSVEVETNLYVDGTVTAGILKGNGSQVTGITNTGIDTIWFNRKNSSADWKNNTSASDWQPDEFLIGFCRDDYTTTGLVEIKLRLFGESNDGTNFYAGARNDTAGTWPIPHQQTSLGAAAWWDSSWNTMTNSGISELRVTAYTANATDWYYIKRALLVVRYTR